MPRNGFVRAEATSNIQTDWSFPASNTHPSLENSMWLLRGGVGAMLAR